MNECTVRSCCSERVWVRNHAVTGLEANLRLEHVRVNGTNLLQRHVWAVEETGINPDDLEPLHTFTDDHDGWSYSTVIARANEKLEGHELNDESHEVRWVNIKIVDQLPLHPSFAKSWPELKALLQSL